MIIDPPPSVVNFVSVKKEEVTSSYEWKTWLNNIYEWSKNVVTSVLTATSIKFSGTTGTITVNTMTTAQRDAMTAENGMLIYNSTTTLFEFYENGAWVNK